MQFGFLIFRKYKLMLSIKPKLARIENYLCRTSCYDFVLLCMQSHLTLSHGINNQDHELLFSNSPASYPTEGLW